MAPKAKTPARMVTKNIGGDKNGGKRTVRVNRLVNNTFKLLIRVDLAIFIAGKQFLS